MTNYYLVEAVHTFYLSLVWVIYDWQHEIDRIELNLTNEWNNVMNILPPNDMNTRASDI